MRKRHAAAETERERRTRRNREKKVRKKEREKVKKLAKKDSNEEEGVERAALAIDIVSNA
jgi:hypothetical protein